MIELITSAGAGIPGFSTAFLHGVMGVLSATLAVIFFVSFQVKGNSVSKKLALFFLFFTLYSLCVTLSIVLFPGDMQIAGWGLIIGLFFVLLVILMGFDTPLFYKHWLFEAHAGRIRIVFAMLWGLCSLYGILFTNPELLPYVGKGNFIYWNLPLVTGWGLGFLCFWAALGWGYLYWSGESLVKESDAETHIKMRTFATNGVLWSIAGPSYIVAPGFWAIVMAFVIMIGTFLATAGVFSYYRIKNRVSAATSVSV
jgi:hypothetical protein